MPNEPLSSRETAVTDVSGLPMDPPSPAGSLPPSLKQQLDPAPPPPKPTPPVVVPPPVPVPTPAPVTAPAKPSAPPPSAPVASPSAPEALMTEEGGEEDLELPTLSDEAIAFMSSARYRESDAGLARDFGLTPDDLSFLNEMDHLVLGGSLPLDGYIQALKEEFPSLSEERRTALLSRLIAERFMPWGDTLTPSAQNVARKENLLLPPTPYFMVYAKPLTYGGVAAEVARSADIPIAGQVQERLREIVKSRHKGVRVDAQVEEQLHRPLDMGGMGLEPEQARTVMLAINDILSRAQVMEEEEYSAWLSSQVPQRVSVASAPASGSATRPIASGMIDTEEDGKEIAKIAAAMPAPVRDTASVLALSTESLLARLSVKPADPYLKRRLEGIVSTRLRDVRNKSEIVMKLARDAKVGGMGLSPEEAERVATEIEDGYAEFHDLIAQEEKEKFNVQSTAQVRRVEERKRREAEEHARWYQEKVQAQRMATEQGSDILTRMRAAQGGASAMPPHPVDVKERVKETAAFGEMVAVEPPRALQGIGPVPAGPSGAIPASAAPPRPAAPPVRVSATSAKVAETASAAQRPRLDDVRSVRELSGPIQELEGLSLSSFRRLSKAPVDAAGRIRQLVDLLAQESFDRRIQGIRAWQGSPLVKQYLSLVTQAFSTATPVDALLAQKKAAGEDVPSPEEFAAIVELNGQLRV